MAQKSAADVTISARPRSGEASATATGRAIPGSEAAPRCTLVIFGAGGDLTKRLLMPALYNLADSHLLDEGLKIIGVDHGDNSDQGWRKALTDTMIKYHADPKVGAFFYTSNDHEKLFARAKDQYDGAQPCGNSIAARNLVRLWQITGDDKYKELAEKTFKAMAATLKSRPTQLTAMLDALGLYLDAQKK